MYKVMNGHLLQNKLGNILVVYYAITYLINLILCNAMNKYSQNKLDIMFVTSYV